MYHISCDKRSVQSAKMIYAALKELLKNHPYETITISKLCEAASIGRVTFYRHFDSIDDVLQLKCDEVFGGMEDYFFNFYKENPYTEPFLKANLRYWYNNSEILEIIFKAGKHQMVLNGFANQLSKFTLPTRGKNDVLCEYKSYFIATRSSMIMSILEQWIADGKNIPPDRLSEIIIEQTMLSFNLKKLTI